VTTTACGIRCSASRVERVPTAPPAPPSNRRRPGETRGSRSAGVTGPPVLEPPVHECVTQSRDHDQVDEIDPGEALAVVDPRVDPFVDEHTLPPARGMHLPDPAFPEDHKLRIVRMVTALSTTA
jgi:hypothetical protein